MLRTPRSIPKSSSTEYCTLQLSTPPAHLPTPMTATITPPPTRARPPIIAHRPIVYRTSSPYHPIVYRPSSHLEPRNLIKVGKLDKRFHRIPSYCSLNLLSIQSIQSSTPLCPISPLSTPLFIFNPLSPLPLTVLLRLLQNSTLEFSTQN